MTPVQQKVLTELPSNSSDCLVQAKTGTGKTIAFLLPALQNLLLGKKPLPSGQVGILILSPTRELAIQIAKECDRLTAKLPRPIQCHTAFGGTARATHLNKFINGNPTVLVATPGRLNDYLGDEEVQTRFTDLRTLILDEADRMLDAGFLPDIKRILRSLPEKKRGWQGMCFSATIPPAMKDVFNIVLSKNYTHLSTVDDNETPTIESVPQYSVVTPGVKETLVSLFALLKQESATTQTDFKVIIFGTTANGVGLLHATFSRLARSIRPDLQVFQLQSRLSQTVRTRTTEDFKVASSGLMFASDVIGRGLDFPNVGLVIQVGLPMNSEQYIHRVGRTARAGQDGRAVILLTTAESYFVHVNKMLPIQPYPTDIAAVAPNFSTEVEAALDTVDEVTKAKAYQAFLGFNKAFMKNLRTSTAGLVAMANEFAEAMQCPEQPMIDKRVVGKMGLKGVPGLRVGIIDSNGPPRNNKAKQPKANVNPNPNANANASFASPGTGSQSKETSSNGRKKSNRGRGKPQAANGHGGQNGSTNGTSHKRRGTNAESGRDAKR